MKRENDHIWTAAEETNREFGQWVPQRWLEIFIGKIATPLPLPSVDGLKRALCCPGGCLRDEDCWSATKRNGAHVQDQVDAILALLGGSAR